MNLSSGCVLVSGCVTVLLVGCATIVSSGLSVHVVSGSLGTQFIGCQVHVYTDSTIFDKIVADPINKIVTNPGKSNPSFFVVVPVKKIVKYSDNGTITYYDNGTITFCDYETVAGPDNGFVVDPDNCIEEHPDKDVITHSDNGLVAHF